MPPSTFAKPLLVAAAIAALAGGFLSVYYISAKHFFSASNQALSALFQQPLEAGPNELKLSPRLSVPGSNKSARPRLGSPAIPAWLPMLLFVYTIAGGWWLHWWLRDKQPHGQEFSGDAESSPNLSGALREKNKSHIPLDAAKNGQVESPRLVRKLAQRDQQIATLHAQMVSLRSERDPLESQNSDDAPSLTEEELTHLRKENQSKSAIIQTLEELVSENREKWLVSDNTESVMRREIAELTENLNAAMVIIRAYDSAPDRSDASEPNLEPPGNEPASN